MIIHIGFIKCVKKRLCSWCWCFILESWNVHLVRLSSACSGVASCLAGRIFDTIWSTRCSPVCYTFVFATCRWSRGICRFFEAEGRRRSNSIIWSSTVDVVVIGCKVTNTTRGPSCWWGCVIHVSSYVGACLSIVVPWYACTAPEIMIHSEIVADFVGNDLSKDSSDLLKWISIEIKIKLI